MRHRPGLLASAGIFIAQTDNRWAIAVILGLATAVVDYLVHPGMFGPVFTEAAVTGIGAAVLSCIVGTAWQRVRAARAVSR